MGIFHTEPFFPGFAYFLLVFVGDVRLLAVNGIADVDFVLENTLDLLDCPCISFVIGSIRINVGECAVSRVIKPTGCWNALINENPRDFGRTGSPIGKIKDFLNDPTGFLVDLDQILTSLCFL